MTHDGRRLLPVFVFFKSFFLIFLSQSVFGGKRHQKGPVGARVLLAWTGRENMNG